LLKPVQFFVQRITFSEILSLGFKLNIVKLDLADRYRIKLLLEEGRSTAEVARIMGVSQRTVQYVASRPIFQVDEEELKIKRFIERHPHYSPQRVAEKLGVSLYKVYKVIKKFLDVSAQTDEDRKALQLAKELLDMGRVEDAARLIHMITLLPKDHSILMRIPDNLLEPSYRLSKIRYKMFNWDVPFDEILKELEEYLDYLLKKKLFLYYYQGHILKFSILNYNGRFREVVEFYKKHRKKIMALPYGIRINLIAPIVEAAVSISKRGVYSPLIKYLYERVRKDDFDVEWHRRVTRQTYFSVLHLLGIYNRVYMLDERDNPLVRALHLLGAGRYEEVAYMGEIPSGKLYAFHMILFKNIARIMVNMEEEPIDEEYMGILYTNPVSRINYHRYLALKEVRRGNTDGARVHLREIIRNSREGVFSRVYRALLNGDYKSLKETPREILLKYWMKQDIGRAVSYALKFGMVFPLHEYALFLPPASIRAYKYDILLPVLSPPRFRVEGEFVYVGSRRIRMGRSAVDKVFKDLLNHGKIPRMNLDSRIVASLLKKYFPLVRTNKYDVILVGIRS